MKKISGSKVFMPRVVVSVPCSITEVEKRAVVDAISASGVRKICLIEEPVAAAMGAGMDIAAPHGSLVVDIGEALRYGSAFPQRHCGVQFHKGSR